MNSKPNECLIEVKKNHEGVVLIKPLGAYLTGQAWVEKLRSVIDDIIERRKNPRVILNMSMVEHLSSSLIGELIGTYRKMERAKGQLCIAAVQQSVNEIFHITRLHQSFQIQETLEKAAASFDS
ncbi:MAG: STAS domain-containing protein [Phycisphaeraceae bacterium]|nr:STAS domain-containing protein [Phycisphaeraceae bacterium]